MAENQIIEEIQILAGGGPDESQACSKDSEARFVGYVEGLLSSLVMWTELGRCAIIAPV